MQQRGSGNTGSAGTGGANSGERGLHVDNEYIVEIISDHSSSSSESQTFYEDDFSTSDDSSEEGRLSSYFNLRKVNDRNVTFYMRKVEIDKMS